MKEDQRTTKNTKGTEEKKDNEWTGSPAIACLRSPQAM